MPLIVGYSRCDRVALRKESVDRNTHYIANNKLFQVALRKESVDRNLGDTVVHSGHALSLSARRAWIEIVFCLVCPALQPGRSPQGERG